MLLSLFAALPMVVCTVITMGLALELLHDSDDRVRMEAPEIFRVLGKRRPEFVKPYLDELKDIAATDSNRVVSIHCLGAVHAV